MVLPACANHSLVITPGVNVSALGLCIEFDEHTGPDEKLLYLNATSELVEEYNRAGQGFSLAMCNPAQEHQLKIVIQKTRFVDPGEQALYVGISAAGIIYPLTGGNFIFAWFGLSTSNLAISTSKNLSSDKKPIYTQFYSSPYFMSADNVRIKHMEKYKVYISELVKDVETKLNNNLVNSSKDLDQL